MKEMKALRCARSFRRHATMSNISGTVALGQPDPPSKKRQQHTPYRKCMWCFEVFVWRGELGLVARTRPAKQNKQQHTLYRICMWCVAVLCGRSGLGLVTCTRPANLNKQQHTLYRICTWCVEVCFCVVCRVGSRARATRQPKIEPAHTLQNTYVVC